jgi:2-oxo-3-hexenedioate decarboxylase/2-keto-4-pentenoate hydratase
MNEESARAAAALLARNRQARTRFAGLPAHLTPQTVADGYRVQDHVHAALGGALAGHKIGCTTRVMQTYLNIDQPCAGRIFADDVHHGDARLRHDAYVRPGVECEIAVLLGRDLPATDAPYDRHAVEGAVEAVMAAIEIVDDRYVDFRALGAPTLIGDDFFNAGSVLGAPLRDWRNHDLAALAGGISINATRVGRGTGAQIMGHPLTALAWLANLRADQGQMLRAGTFVSLGSLVETKWIQPGDHVEVALDHLGRVNATFQA